MMIPAYKKGMCCFSFETGTHYRRKSSPSFPKESTSMPYSGFEPNRLQAEGHIHHTGSNVHCGFDGLFTNIVLEAIRGLLATDVIILNHCLGTKAITELEPHSPDIHSIFLNLNRFNMHPALLQDGSVVNQDLKETTSPMNSRR
ncbi:hypothetical protein TNCV_1448401 [Trichonephila clavipes]|nr:hypothetical protein TNCV_1448401 [Trichonephila clavipes]